MRWLPFLRQRRLDYEAVFQTEIGRRVLADLASHCGFGQDAFVAGDPHQTSYNLGSQRAILHVRAVLDMTAEEMFEIAKAQEGIPEDEAA